MTRLVYWTIVFVCAAFIIWVSFFLTGCASHSAVFSDPRFNSTLHDITNKKAADPLPELDTKNDRTWGQAADAQ